eukprot:158042_1
METTLNGIMEHFQKFRESASKLWDQSQYLRIVSLVTGSLAATLTMRNIYIRMYRKYYKLPHGPVGVIPFLGQSFDILHPARLVQFATNYGALTSFIMGPYNGILINDPHLAKQLYSDPRTVDIPSNFAVDMGFAFQNGKAWSERRRIIYSNLMTTMKASYVENATKQFLKTKVFPVFDANIQNNEPTTVKPLFRPIGFNIVLQACFGKVLSSLDDEYWIKYNKQATHNNRHADLQSIIILLLGLGPISEMVQKMLTGDDFLNGFDKLIDIIDEFTKNQSRDIERDQDDDGVKLFNDYVENYVNNKDGSKWTRRQLLSDMATMFFGATDATFSTLAFTLLIAAKYPSMQNEIHEEIVAAFGDHVDDIELKNLGFTKIPKLRALIHESLRIFPGSQIIGFRQITKDGLTLQTKEKVYGIPKGVCVCINACGIQRNPKYWISDYDPISNEYHKNINMKEPHLDFWMDDEGRFSKKKNSASLFAFHVGKRDCVGQALVMKELMIVLAMIFLRYEVVPNDGKTDFEIESKFRGIILEPVIEKIRFQLRK